MTRNVCAKVLVVVGGLLILAFFVLLGCAPWLHGPDSARMLGTAFVTLVAGAAVGGAGLVLAAFR